MSHEGRDPFARGVEFALQFHDILAAQYQRIVRRRFVFAQGDEFLFELSDAQRRGIALTFSPHARLGRVFGLALQGVDPAPRLADGALGVTQSAHRGGILAAESAKLALHIIQFAAQVVVLAVKGNKFLSRTGRQRDLVLRHEHTEQPEQNHTTQRATPEERPPSRG